MTKKAFTLVELIVVITILAILGTISFITYSWHTTNVRDSARISDLWNIHKVISVYEVINWTYPPVTDWVEIYHDWDILFTQWVFWKDTISKMWWIINQAPVDIITWRPYSYSLSWNRINFQVWWYIEWDQLSRSIVPTANASTEFWKAILQWNYNWQFISIINWENVKIVASPSITLNDLSDNDFSNIVLENKFVYDLFFNLPATYSDTRYNLSASSNSNFINTSDYLLFSWTIDELNSEENQLLFLERLQNSYINTDIQNKFLVSRIFEFDLNSNRDESLKYSKWILNNFVSNKIQN